MQPSLSIPDRIAAVKQVLGLSVRDGGTAQAVSDAWKVLLGSCNPKEFWLPRTPTGNALLWEKILEAKLVQEVIELIPLTMEHESREEEDTSADAIRFGFQLLSYCYTQAQACDENPESQVSYLATSEALTLLTENTPDIIADWWEQCHGRASEWFTSGMFSHYTFPAINLLQSLASEMPSATRSIGEYDEFAEDAFCQDPSLQDLLLSYATFGDRGVQIRDDSIMFTVTTAIVLPLSPCEELPAFHALQELRPNALSARIGNELVRQNLSEDYLNLIRFLGFMCGHAIFSEDLYEKVGSGLWKAYREEGDAFLKESIVYQAVYLLNALASRAGTRGKEVTTQLLVDFDYLSLMGKLVMWAVTYPMEGDPLPWDEFLATLLQSPETLKIYVRRDFLHVLNCIRPFAKNSDKELAREALKWWEDLAAAVGLSEIGLFAEGLAERTKARGDGPTGCAWFKCIRFERDCDPLLLFQCAGCHKLKYCGVRCQER
ncbi:hypothetical protein FRB96_001302 [Tulasnella sp. 330]|nr:hypothetical protein FRB96_001302 [Tulasnella sp. 330]KAG8877622.1 hypothetical protein FRB98_006603 [Tulasnella sp. 332]